MTTSTNSQAQTTAINKIWLVLKYTFGLVPIVAGLDKFTHILVDWDQYLNPAFLQVLPISAKAFMSVVGIIEIAAGLLVLFKTRLGAFVVSAWLVCIALTLIASVNYLDVAVRDLVMAVGAFTLAQLTLIVDEPRAK